MEQTVEQKQKELQRLKLKRGHAEKAADYLRKQLEITEVRSAGLLDEIRALESGATNG